MVSGRCRRLSLCARHLGARSAPRLLARARVPARAARRAPVENRFGVHAAVRLRCPASPLLTPCLSFLADSARLYVLGQRGAPAARLAGEGRGARSGARSSWAHRAAARAERGVERGRSRGEPALRGGRLLAGRRGGGGGVAPRAPRAGCGFAFARRARDLRARAPVRRRELGPPWDPTLGPRPLGSRQSARVRTCISSRRSLVRRASGCRAGCSSRWCFLDFVFRSFIW